MELKKLIDSLKDEIFDEATQWDRDRLYVNLQHETPSGGVLDVAYWMDGSSRDFCEVTVYGEGKSQDFDNMESYLANALSGSLDWRAVEESWRDADMDEYQRNGFASEADFWRWKEG